MCEKTRTCSHCKQDLPATTEFFEPNGKYLYSICRPCVKKKRRLRNSGANLLKKWFTKINYTSISRRCFICHKTLPLDRFSGVKRECKDCYNDMNREVTIQNNPYKLLRREKLNGYPDGYEMCIICEDVKPLVDFRKELNKTSGYGIRCKDCCNEKAHIDRKKPERRAKELESAKKWINADPVRILQRRVSFNLWSGLKSVGKKKIKPSFKLLGYSREFLLNYLNDNPYGYKFGGDKIIIEHIIPKVLAKTEDDVIAVNHWTNLRLWPAKDNAIKQANLPHITEIPVNIHRRALELYYEARREQNG